MGDRIPRIELWLALIAGLACASLIHFPVQADACPDALITAGVKTRLTADDVLAPFRINVDTEECIVTLKGCVDSVQKIRRARQLAGKMKWVKGVKSQLSVCPKKK